VENRLARHARHDLDRGTNVDKDLMGGEEPIASTASHQSDASASADAGGRQSTRLTGTP
jgi:hypothetical protein